MTKAKTAFEKAYDSFPCAECLDAWQQKTIEDLVYLAETEIDLILEDQDGTDRRDLPKLRKWLKKWKTPKAKGA